MVEAWLGPGWQWMVYSYVLIRFTSVHHDPYGRRDMFGAQQRMVYSVLCNSWLIRYGLQCTLQLMVEDGRGGYQMVYSVQCNSWLNHRLVCSDMVYSLPHDSWLRHGWGLAADGLQCTV